MTRFWHQTIWILLATCILLGCNRIQWSGDVQKTVEAHLVKAKKLYEQRDYAGAIDAYEKILRIQPDDSDAHFKIALIYDRNLNDYLNAAYHYQQFLKSSNLDSGNADLARSSLENVKLQLAATVPNVSGQSTPELVKLRSENEALHRQVEELKREIVRTRGTSQAGAHGAFGALASPKPSAERGSAGENPVAVSRVIEDKPPLPEKADAKPQSHSRTYAVKKGEGIQAIAEKIYGDRRKWRDILAANPNIKNPNQLKPGQVLNLP